MSTIPDFSRSSSFRLTALFMTVPADARRRDNRRRRVSPADQELKREYESRIRRSRASSRPWRRRDRPKRRRPRPHRPREKRSPTTRSIRRSALCSTECSPAIPPSIAKCRGSSSATSQSGRRKGFRPATARSPPRATSTTSSSEVSPWAWGPIPARRTKSMLEEAYMQTLPARRPRRTACGSKPAAPLDVRLPERTGTRTATTSPDRPLPYRAFPRTTPITDRRDRGLRGHGPRSPTTEIAGEARVPRERYPCRAAPKTVSTHGPALSGWADDLGPHRRMADRRYILSGNSRNRGGGTARGRRSHEEWGKKRSTGTTLLLGGLVHHGDTPESTPSTSAPRPRPPETRQPRAW